MPKCVNCSRWTQIPKDLICPYCGKQISSKEQGKILKHRQDVLENVNRTIDILDQIGSEPLFPRNTRTQRLKIIILGIVYLIIFADVEFVAYFVSPSLGMIFSFIVLLILIINASIIPLQAHRGFLLSLALVPLIRIVSLAVPVLEISRIYWYLIISVPIFTGIVTISRNLDYSFDDIGFNLKKPVFQLFIAIAGIGLSILNYIIFKQQSLVDNLTVQTIVVPALILIISTGFVEEMVFRGVIQKAAITLGSWGWVYVAVIYAVLQIGSKSIYHIFYIFFISLLFGWVVKKTGSIIGVSISHGLLNVGLYLVFPHVDLPYIT